MVTQTKQLLAKKKPIQDIASWMETYVAIRNKKSPELTIDLLAYGAVITQEPRDYKVGWLTYDFQFRRLAAARKTGSIKWSSRDIALWNYAVCRPALSTPPLPHLVKVMTN